MKPRVLMATGAYFPETSGGGLQARAVIRALRQDADFVVLTTSADPGLPAFTDEDGVEIHRVFVDVENVPSKATAALRLARAFLRLSSRIDIVNLHGFSAKAVIFAGLSRLLGKRFVLTLQTSVHDEPAAARRAGPAAYWAYRSADLYLSVSPGLTRGYLDGGLPASRLRQVTNAVETDRFRPAAVDERQALRSELGLPRDARVALFVGYFSRDKRPDAMYRAWAALAARDGCSVLVMVGATRPVHGEVDAALAPSIREWAARDGLSDRLFFVEATPAIERYFRAADVYVMPSVREGTPLALLEAMSSGLPCIATRLPGSTDVLIDDAVNGLLVKPGDENELSAAMQRIAADSDLSARLGAGARTRVIERYSIEKVAPMWLSAYRELAPS